MKQLMLFLTLVFAASITAPVHAQDDVVRVQIEAGETCPSGWATVFTAWTKPARIFYVLPNSLVPAFTRTVIGRVKVPVEIEVSQSFVDSVYPTPAQKQTAYSSGKLRAVPATSGTVRTCTLGQ